MPKKGPPEDEATPTSTESFNPPKASSATLAALLEALKAPPPTEGAPRPLPAAAGIAGAILGALDPEGYQRLVTPALQERKTEARRQYQTAREQRGENLQNLTEAYNLQTGAEDRATTLADEAMQRKARDLKYASDLFHYEEETTADNKERADAYNTFAMQSALAEKDLDFADQEVKRLGSYPSGRPESDIMHRHARRIYAAQAAVREMLAGVQNDSATDPKKLTAQYLNNATATLQDVEAALKEAHTDEEKFAYGHMQAQMAMDAAKARAENRPLKLLPSAEVVKLGQNKEIARMAYQALAKWRELGQPGGWSAVGGPVTPAQREFRSYLQRVTVPLRNRLFGAALSDNEKQSSLGLVPTDVDILGDTFQYAMESIIDMMQGGYNRTVSEHAAAGYSTGSLNWDVTPQDVPPQLPPGMTPLTQEDLVTH